MPELHTFSEPLILWYRSLGGFKIAKEDDVSMQRLQIYWRTVACHVCRYLVWLGSNRQAMVDRVLVMHTVRPDAQGQALAAPSQQHGSGPP